MIKNDFADAGYPSKEPDLMSLYLEEDRRFRTSYSSDSRSLPCGLYSPFGEDDIRQDRYAGAGQFYDYTMLPTAFAPLAPLFKAILHSNTVAKELKKNRLELFLENFGFRRIYIPELPHIAQVKVDMLGSDVEPYYTSAPNKLRARFLTGVEREDYEAYFGHAWGRYYANYTMIRLHIDSIDDALHDKGLVRGHLSVDWGQTSVGRVCKDSAIAIPTVRSWFAPILTALETFPQIFDDIIDFTNSKGALSILHTDIDNTNSIINSIDNVKSQRWGRVSGELIKFNPNLTLVGTEEDFAYLDGVASRLNLSTDCPRFTVDSSIFEAKQSAATMNMIMGMTGSKSDFSYGCLMYLVWLACNPFYLSSWRGATAMRDWLHTATNTDIIACLNKVDTYAAYRVNGAWILATSCGFARLADGTLENPKSVVCMDLDETLSNCGLIRSELSEARKSHKFFKSIDTYQYAWYSDKERVIIDFIQRISNYYYCVLRNHALDYVFDNKVGANKNVLDSRGCWAMESSSTPDGRLGSYLANRISQKNFSGTKYSWEGFNSDDGLKEAGYLVSDIYNYLQQNATEIRTFATPLTRKAGVVSYDITKGEPTSAPECRHLNKLASEYPKQ